MALIGIEKNNKNLFLTVLVNNQVEFNRNMFEKSTIIHSHKLE
jgi:hypothetical protein